MLEIISAISAIKIFNLIPEVDLNKRYFHFFSKDDI
jgi:hypothetical protein